MQLIVIDCQFIADQLMLLHQLFLYCILHVEL